MGESSMHRRAVMSCGLSTEMGGALHSLGYYLPSRGTPPPGVSPQRSHIAAQLQSKELWKRFNSVGTEMILTKGGRRMFPEFSVSVSGLDPRGLYTLCVQAVPEGDTRYKWRDGAWSKSGRAEPGPPTHLYVHPESPAPGHRWMDRPICFSKIRLTNNTLSQGGQIVLQSMHRYHLRLYIIPTSSRGPHVEMSFPETSFMAVTSYQNPKLSLLKIEENPFAKGIKFFKNQQENHTPGKRPPSQSGAGSPGCKKFIESLEERDIMTDERPSLTEDIAVKTEETAENREERPLISEENLHIGQEILEVTDESADITGKRHTEVDEFSVSNQERHLEEPMVTAQGPQCMPDETAKWRRRRPVCLDIASSERSVQWSSVTQRQLWVSPTTPSPVTVTPCSNSGCPSGHRFTHPQHTSFARFPSPSSQMLPIAPATMFHLPPWGASPVRLSSPFPGVHPELFQQMYPAPWYLPPPSTCRGL